MIPLDAPSYGDLVAEVAKSRERVRIQSEMLAEMDHLAAEVGRLNELLRGVGANRYWEGRWRDLNGEFGYLRALNAEMLAAAKKVDHLALVIESAMRHAKNGNYNSVLFALKATSNVISKAGEQS